VKKIFHIEQEKRNRDRAVEAIKHELRKYIKREKKKKLPNSITMYWDFDCKFGQNSEDAKVSTFDEVIKLLDKANSDNWNECYIEVIAKAINKPIKEDV